MLGTDLRAAREERGLSVPAVAHAAGLSLSSLYAIERGDRYPSLATLEALAECLQVTVVIGPHETTVER
jgi:transcriptional regulator with XRE-family HTH domain